MQADLLAAIDLAFSTTGTPCLMSLKQADEIDSSYSIQSTDDPIPTDWQQVQDVDLETHHWGLCHLDPASWLFYLPAFLAYSMRHHASDESLVVGACIQTLRPPDSTPPRLAALTGLQRQTVVAVLEFLAFEPDSGFHADACQALEEYWLPDPMYPP